MFLFINFAFICVYLVYKKIVKDISYDLNQVKNYLEEINEKNYEAVIKTKHFSEFLQIELLLKNISKRLRKRDGKK